jgi:hypothetical protein
MDKAGHLCSVPQKPKDGVKGKCMNKNILAVITSMILVLALASVAMAADPFVGTWKLNVEKSTFSPGPVPKSDILKIGAQDSALKLLGNGVDAEGKSGHYELSLIFDEKDYPSVGFPGVDTTSSKRINTNNIVTIDKRAGKEVGSWRFTASKDGKTLTCATKGKDAKGQNISLAMVYDKQ